MPSLPPVLISPRSAARTTRPVDAWPGPRLSHVPVSRRRLRRAAEPPRRPAVTTAPEPAESAASIPTGSAGRATRRTAAPGRGRGPRMPCLRATAAARTVTFCRRSLPRRRSNRCQRSSPNLWCRVADVFPERQSRAARPAAGPPRRRKRRDGVVAIVFSDIDCVAVRRTATQRSWAAKFSVLPSQSSWAHGGSASARLKRQNSVFGEIEFPSWTSRVRVPSPGPCFQQFRGSHLKRFYLVYLEKWVLLKIEVRFPVRQGLLRAKARSSFVTASRRISRSRAAGPPRRRELHCESHAAADARHYSKGWRPGCLHRGGNSAKSHGEPRPCARVLRLCSNRM